MKIDSFEEQKTLEWNVYKSHPIDVEHFWEIGYSDISGDAVIEMIKNKDLKIIKHFRNEFNRYHHFFMLKL